MSHENAQLLTKTLKLRITNIPNYADMDLIRERLQLEINLLLYGNPNKIMAYIEDE